MCVVAICQVRRLTPEEVNLMFDANQYGSGIAWRDKDKKGNTIVKWEKGLVRSEILELSQEVPLPYIAHFRIPTDGGSLKGLTHPFSIDASASVQLRGETKGSILFHNGRWSSWRNSCQEIAMKSGKPLPPGPWSDTRGMAYAAYVLGEGILEFINEKVVVFSPEGINLYGDGWSLKDEIHVSNCSWTRSYSNYSDRRSLPAHYSGKKEEEKKEEKKVTVEEKKLNELPPPNGQVQTPSGVCSSKGTPEVVSGQPPFRQEGMEDLPPIGHKALRRLRKKWFQEGKSLQEVEAMTLRMQKRIPALQ